MSDGSAFVVTMMRACWVSVVAYIGYNLFAGYASGENRFPPPSPSECLDSYEDLRSGECADPGAYQAAPQGRGGRNSCCDCEEELRRD